MVRPLRRSADRDQACLPRAVPALQPDRLFSSTRRHGASVKRHRGTGAHALPGACGNRAGYGSRLLRAGDQGHPSPPDRVKLTRLATRLPHRLRGPDQTRRTACRRLTGTKRVGTGENRWKETTPLSGVSPRKRGRSLGSRLRGSKNSNVCHQPVASYGGEVLRCRE